MPFRSDLESDVTRLSALHVSAALSGLLVVPVLAPTAAAAAVGVCRLRLLQAACLALGVLPFLGLQLCATPVVSPALSFVLFGLVRMTTDERSGDHLGSPECLNMMSRLR